MTQKNIVLCGFMGCGKSTIGKQLAKIMNRKYVDIDIYIEKKQNMTVKEIFDKYGEDFFRELEHKTSKELSQEKNLVIATGGGTLLFERNYSLLSKTGIIVLLDTSLSTIRYRLRNDTKRPLLQRPDKYEVMTKLYKERIPIYRKVSDVAVKCRKPPKDSAKKILAVLEEYQETAL